MSLYNVHCVEAAKFDTPHLMAKKSFDNNVVISSSKKIKNIYLHYENLEPSKEWSGWRDVNEKFLTQYFIMVLRKDLEDRGYALVEVKDEADLTLNLKIKPDVVIISIGTPSWTGQSGTKKVPLLKVEAAYATDQGEWKNLFIGHREYFDWGGERGYSEIGPIELAEGIIRVIEQVNTK